MATAPPSELDQQFAAFLNELLKKNAWTYSDLERASGIKKSMLHNIVNHERGASLSLVSRLCKNMDVGLADIFPSGYKPSNRSGRRSS